MSSKHQVYNKQNSFEEVRYHHALEDVLPRLREARSRLGSAGLDSYRQSIVQDAVGEVLGEIAPPEGSPPFILHSYNMEEISRLADGDLPRYLFYRYRYETFPQRRQLDAFPPCLQIEPTSICNYRCIFCYQSDSEFTHKSNGMMGMMPLDLFKAVIDQAEGRCEAVSLASRGEPLICQDFSAMLDYAAEKFLALKVNTNAWFLDERMCHTLLESGVSTLVFSADAADEPSYSQLRVGGRLDRVFKNVRRFHEIREKHYPQSRMITRVAGVKVSGTSDLNEMERFWGEYVDQVSFVNYNPWENIYSQPVNHIQTPCSDLWRRVFIWWDGSVNPCDSDYKSALKIGNINGASVGDLWKSDVYMRLRDFHTNEKRFQCAPCNRCSLV
jgi:radical SAM protein with 4Fe4S-binding SPASM domain